jgi:hypothetical protein
MEEQDLRRWAIREEFDRLLRDFDSATNSSTNKPRFGQRYPELTEHILGEIAPYTPPSELEKFWL